MTSSPESFYYAVEGYFDNEENRMLILRKVAEAASAGNLKEGAFSNWWPLPKQESVQIPSWAASSLEFRKELLAQRKIAESKEYKI